MRRINVLQTFLVVSSPFVVNKFVFWLDLNGVNLQTIDKFLSICCTILREVHIDKACQGMSISSDSHISMFIRCSIHNLLMKSAFFITITYIRATLSINCISTKDSIPLLRIELFNCSFFLILNLFGIVFFEFSDFFFMSFFEINIFFHDAIHVFLINININHFFPLLQHLIFIFQSQFLAQLFLQTVQFIFFIQLCSLSVIDGRFMSLVVFWLISLGVRIHIECLEMISIDYTSNRIFCVGPSIGLQSSFIKIILILCICQGSSIGSQIFNIFQNFLSSFLFPIGLFLMLFFSNPISNLDSLILLF